jgi:hypothetical protein
MIRCRLVPGLRTLFVGLILVVAGRMFWILPSSTLVDQGNAESSSSLGIAPLNAEMEPILRKTTTTHTNNSNETTPLAYRHPNFRVDFPLCLVHIGKEAGSSVSCGLGLMYADCEGMPRDKLPHTHFFHMRRNNCPTTTSRQKSTATPVTRTYAVTLRNPLTRLQSWFDFEKDIVPTRGRNSPQAQEQIRNQRAMLFQECYATFDRFVLDGLVQFFNNETVTAANPKEMTCPERAWAAVLGVRAFSYHEWYNYEYYWTGIQPKGGFLNGTSEDTQTSSSSFSPLPPIVYALRTEHLQQDWKTVSREPLFRPVNRRKPESSSNTATNTTHTSPTFLLEEPRAREQLCQALCPEMQFYKQFLLISKNLSPAQQQESLLEIQNYCPLETSLQIRDCPGIPTFPKIRVPARQYRTEIKKRLYEIS